MSVPRSPASLLSGARRRTRSPHPACVRRPPAASGTPRRPTTSGSRASLSPLSHTTSSRSGFLGQRPGSGLSAAIDHHRVTESKSLIIPKR
jgi:hypothetical protein